MYYIPGSGQSTERGQRLLMWGYYLQVPEGALSSVLVDDHERQQSSSVPFGMVHPQVKADLEARLADLLPSSLFALVQQCGNSSIQAVYSVAARSYARDRVCLVGDAGAVFPPFTGSGVLRAVANATFIPVDGVAQNDSPRVIPRMVVLRRARRMRRSAYRSASQQKLTNGGKPCPVAAQLLSVTQPWREPARRARRGCGQPRGRTAPALARVASLPDLVVDLLSAASEPGHGPAQTSQAPPGLTGPRPASRSCQSKTPP